MQCLLPLSNRLPAHIQIRHALWQRRAKEDGHNAHLSTSVIVLATHYEVLGVTSEATQKEIKEAYLQLSKELHPDKQNQLDESSQKKINIKYMAVSQAYTVLSKPMDRNNYDLSLFHSHDGGPSRVYGSPTMRGYRAMTFEERCRAAGFPETRHDFYGTGKRKYYIAAGCVLLMVWGAVLHYAIALMTFKKHQQTMLNQTAALQKMADDPVRKLRFERETWIGRELTRKRMEKKEEEMKRQRELELASQA